jgi:polyphosphate glucokinase
VSGSKMTARKMVRDVKRVTKDWEYGVVSIGYPGPVIHGRPLLEPHNLASGWVGFNFGKAFGCPSRLSMMLPCRRSEATQGGPHALFGSWRRTRISHARRWDT